MLYNKGGIFITHLFGHTVNVKEKKINLTETEGPEMKGFNTDDGYMGLVDGRYILFASEADYYDYIND